VQANSSGAFQFIAVKPLAGPNVTATVTDRQGNTSAFATPRASLMHRIAC
jgi:hypothetical protein